MKKNNSNKIRLGIFVTVGTAIFIIGIYFIGQQQQLFRSTFHVSGVFKDVAGLQAGSNVRFSGINVGTVRSVSIVNDTSVRVDILIDESTRSFIKKDAVASIGSDGLMGNKILIVIPGIGGKAVIENNDIIATAPPIDMDEVLISLKTTLDNTSHITGNLSAITSNIQAGNGTIGRLLMDQSMAENFDSAIVNLKEGSEGLKGITNDAKDSFAANFYSTFINLKEASVGFKILMDKAKKSWLLWGF